MSAVTPRSTIRAWMRAQLEAGRYDNTEIVEAAIERFADDPDVATALVAMAVKAEVSSLPGGHTGIRHQPQSRASLRAQIEADAPESPFRQLVPAQEPNILLDMASMGKVELHNLAIKLERESDSAALSAVFVRNVASHLSETDKVRDRFDRDALLRMRGRINLNIKTTVHLGDRHLPALSSERIRTI